LVQGQGCGGILGAFNSLGFVFTGFFFFLSGYGLMVSADTKADYSTGFIKKRILPIGCLYIAVTILYFAYYSITNHCFDISVLYSGLPSGNPLLPYSWYIIVILAYYLWFYLTLLTMKNHWMWVVSSTIYIILLMAFCMKFSWGNWYYDTSLLLVFGNIWALIKKKTDGFVGKFSYVIFALSIVLCFFSMVAYFMYYFSAFGIALFATLTTLFFTIALLMINVKFAIGNKITRMLGKISLEIYLIQGLLINAVLGEGNGNLNLVNFGLVVILTILAGFMVNKCFEYARNRSVSRR